MNASEIQPLRVDGLRFESCGMPVLLVWGNHEASHFFSLQAAKAALIAARYLKQDSRVQGARVFEWDGTAWAQIAL